MTRQKTFLGRLRRAVGEGRRAVSRELAPTLRPYLQQWRHGRHLRRLQCPGDLYDLVQLSRRAQPDDHGRLVDRAYPMSDARHKARPFFRRLAGDCRGVAAIEFAICAPILLVVMFGIIELGRIMWTQNALHYSV